MIVRLLQGTFDLYLSAAVAGLRGCAWLLGRLLPRGRPPKE